MAESVDRLELGVKKLRVNAAGATTVANLTCPPAHHLRTIEHRRKTVGACQHRQNPEEYPSPSRETAVVDTVRQSALLSGSGNSQEETFGDGFTGNLVDFASLRFCDKSAQPLIPLSKLNHQKEAFLYPRANSGLKQEVSCSAQANFSLLPSTSPMPGDDVTAEELAGYLDELLHLPRKMSQMAEMMYT